MDRLKIRGLFIASLLTVLSACKIGPPVTTDYDTSYDYSMLRNYAWVIKKEPSKVSTLENRRQINAIETVLNRKGFNMVASQDKPDFLIRTHTITDKKVDVNTFYSLWGYYPYYHHYHGPHYYNRTIVREYEVGTLVLDIVDPIKEEVIWRGSVSRKLGVYLNRTPEERASIALTNADYLLKSFPPGLVTED